MGSLTVVELQITQVVSSPIAIDNAGRSIWQTSRQKEKREA
jgi:hypothetical protein